MARSMRRVALLRCPVQLLFQYSQFLTIIRIYTVQFSHPEDLLRSVGAVPLYLPPYSPDFNPIEKMWSKMKAILRKLRVRVPSRLPDAVLHALSAVSLSDCDGWFRCAGY